MTNGSARDDDGAARAPASDPSAADHDAEHVGAISGTLPANHDSSFDELLRGVASVGESLSLLPKTGEVIAGKYRIEELLGRGGMGAVFRAKHLISDKQVAIKWMLRSSSDEHARRRFVREARAAARIDHPNVVDIYDIGQQSDVGIYLVMQLLRGESLRACMARRRLGIAETVDLLLPAMRGVAAVHQAGVIHRDLKPENVFLCEARQDAAREAVVLDFGISAVASGETHDAPLTRDGAVLGTPAYMSPEQLQSSRGLDARTDVYSFGVILYEALTGTLPFSADSYNSLVLAIVAGEPKDPCTVRSDLSRELGNVLLRALAKAREDRYPNFQSLIAALLPYASTRGSGSSDPLASAAAPPTRASTQKPLWVVGALIAALAVALACAWFGRSFGRPAIANVSAAPNTMASPRAKLDHTPAPASPAPAATQPSAGAEPKPAAAAGPTGGSPRAVPTPASKRVAKAAARPMPEARSKPEGAPASTSSGSLKARSGTISPDEL
jgi:serine/threonine protein kinase